MNIGHVEQLFGNCAPNINWARAKKEKWPVKLSVITTREELGKLGSCWTEKGVRGKGGKAMKFADIAKDLRKVGQPWRKRILKLAHSFEEASEQPVVYAALAVNRCVLDANHRAAATMLSGVEFAVLLIEVCPPGPIWSAEDFQ